MGIVTLQTDFCCLLGKVTLLRGVQGNFSGGLGPSNHISLEGVHRFTSSVATKELFFQSNRSLDSNFKVEIPLKIYMLV